MLIPTKYLHGHWECIVMWLADQTSATAVHIVQTEKTSFSVFSFQISDVERQASDAVG